MQQELFAQLKGFIDSCPTCYHVIANLSSQLENMGFERLSEGSAWKVSLGGKYYVTRGQSSIIAFKVPAQKPSGMMATASHSDSPTFRIREASEVPSAGGTVRLSVEGYGSAIMRSWLDKPLSVAGRIFVREGNGVASKIVNVDRDLLVIPSLAIHMNREMNKGVELKANVDMLPLFSHSCENGSFRKLIAKTAGVDEEDIVSTDLFLYPRTPATRLGLNGEFIASPRLDDLECVFGCYQGFKDADTTRSLQVFCVFNNEEVGSGTRQGANSTFFEDTLRRICAHIDMSSEERYTMLANSFMLSADNAHAIHPAHPEYADKNEFPTVNGGIVVKFNAAQKYCSDGLTSAVFIRVCETADAPYQRYSNRADIAGGSTLGNISGTHVSIPTVDIGLPQFAMHSCYETAGIEDLESLVKAAKVFYSRNFRRVGDDKFEL